MPAATQGCIFCMPAGTQMLCPYFLLLIYSVTLPLQLAVAKVIQQKTVHLHQRGMHLHTACDTPCTSINSPKQCFIAKEHHVLSHSFVQAL
eukprot:833525-Pelagomonas_calceolata.AAC.3